MLSLLGRRLDSHLLDQLDLRIVARHHNLVANQVRVLVVLLLIRQPLDRPINHIVIQLCIHLAYHLISLHAFPLFNHLGSRNADHLDSQVCSQVCNRVDNRVDNRLCNHLDSQVGNHLSDLLINLSVTQV